MKSCYVYEHLEIRDDIPGIVAFALIFVERREILEKRSKSDEIVNWCPDFASRYEMTWRTIELGNHYALIRGFFFLENLCSCLCFSDFNFQDNEQKHTVCKLDYKNSHLIPIETIDDGNFEYILIEPFRIGIHHDDQRQIGSGLIKIYHLPGNYRI